MEACVIKTYFEEDLRRFTFPLNGEFKGLYGTIAQLYALTNENLLLHYIDDENDLVSITSTTELQEAIHLTKELGGILKIYVTRNTSMDESSILFESWVKLKSIVEVKQENSEVRPKCEATIKKVEKISNQVNTFKQLLKTARVDDSEPKEHQNEIETKKPPENVTTKGQPKTIREIVLELSKELAKSLAETSQNITSLVNTSVIENGKIETEINNTASEVIALLTECGKYSDGTLSDVRSSSDVALNLVNKHSSEISKLLSSLAEDDTIAILRAGVISDCNSLSSSTVSQCLRDSDAVRDAVLNI